MNLCLVVHKYGVSLDDPCCYPLGFMYVSSIMKQRGHNVKVLNYNLWDYDFKEEIKGSDLVLFTGFEEFKSNIIRDAEICREQGIKTIVGGALATFCPEEMSHYTDKVYVGELDHSTPIDKTPLPDYEGFGIAEYHLRHKVRYMGILTSRGCPFSCTFCSQTCQFRYRDLKSVFDEIDLYQGKYNIDTLIFNDNTLNISKRRFLAICAGMKGRGLKWSAAIRCDKLDDEMAKAAKESGCYYFVVGVESFIQSKLDKMNKRVTVEQIYRTLDLLDKYKIGYHGNILLGFDNESYQDIAQEVSSIPCKYNVFPVLVQPFVGTSDGKTRLITKEESSFLSNVFEGNAIKQGKYLYPQIG